ncbi:MAG TPA: hopanoid biosynthesis-associated protein HpnK [Acidobacteriota bacterium]|nr:hopanoid biosynthesis-associated protein HpnK [Acidobacteriota bacterium]
MTDISASHLPGRKPSRKNVIITGDDFGLALPVNEAVITAHRQGILNTASLMAGAPYFEDAVERARQHPSLNVGLHITLVEGRPVSPPGVISGLVDSEGFFSRHLVRSGFRFFFRRGIRHQLETEIRAQFDAFQKTGLRLDHVNAHNHMHLHPTILKIILATGKEYGMRAARMPWEPPLRSWRAAGNRPAARFMSSLFLRPLLKLMRMKLRREHIACNDFLFGMTDSGKMTTELVLRIIGHLPDGITEICFHPATRRSREINATMPGYAHEKELAALTGSSVREALDGAGIRIMSFSDIASAGRRIA